LTPHRRRRSGGGAPGGQRALDGGLGRPRERARGGLATRVHQRWRQRWRSSDLGGGQRWQARARGIGDRAEGDADACGQ